jgi:hypothetical protein
LELYEKLIYENLEKGYQYRVTVSEFRDQEYLHVRKYFLSYEGEWIPSKEGSAFPCTIQNTYAMLDAMLDICSKLEGGDALVSHLENKIMDLQNPSF